MTHDLIVMLAVLGAAVVMFALGRPRPDVVALMMVVALPLTGILTPAEAVAGFSNAAVILLAGMLVIGEGLARTGVTHRVGDWLIARGGTSELRVMALAMLLVAVLGSVMYKLGMVAIFIPVALRIALQTGMAPNQLLMPISFAALTAGSLTLVGSSHNMIISSELLRTGADGFGFFTLTPIGLPILIACIGYMAIARRWLRPPATKAAGARRAPSLTDWVATYGLAEREFRLRVRPESPLVGRRIEELPALASADDEAATWLPVAWAPDAFVIAIQRDRRLGQDLMRPAPDLVIEADDVLLIDTPSRPLGTDSLCQSLALERLPLSGAYFTDQAQQVGMVEVLVPAGSRFADKTIAASALETLHGLDVVGLRRGQQTLPAARLATETLKVGDTLLLLGQWRAISPLRGNGTDLVVLNLPQEFDEVLPAPGRAPLALLALAITIGLMSSGLLPAMHAALIGALLMGLFGCIDAQSAYRAISLRTIVLIAGMLPVAVALDRAGGVDLAASALIGLLGDAGPHLILAVLFAITVLMGLFIVAAANAVLVIPVALAIAAELGLSPFPFAIAVAIAAASPYMTPLSPVNAMVTTAGNYRFSDFLRIGFPMVLIALTITLLLVPWLYPF